MVLAGLVSRSDMNGKAGVVTALDMERLRADVRVERHRGVEVLVKFSNLAVREPPPQRKVLGKVRLCDATDVCGKCGAMAARVGQVLRRIVPECPLVEAQAAVPHAPAAGRAAGAAGDHQLAVLQRQPSWRLAGSDRFDRGGGRRELG